MDLTVEIGSRPRRVRVVRQGDRLLVTLDGRAHVVDVRWLGAGEMSLLLIGQNGAAPRSVEAAVAPAGPRGAFEVHVAGHRVQVQAQTGVGAAGRETGAGSAAAGPLRVTAPMPGKIVRILVKPGDDVRTRQGLIVVEAMKMENELRAARDGRVRAVPVAEGQSVDAGMVLVEIDPNP